MIRTTKFLLQKSTAVLLSVCLISGWMTESSLLHAYAEEDDEITVTDVEDTSEEEIATETIDVFESAPPRQTRSLMKTSL